MRSVGDVFYTWTEIAKPDRRLWPRRRVCDLAVFWFDDQLLLPCGLAVFGPAVRPLLQCLL